MNRTTRAPVPGLHRGIIAAVLVFAALAGLLTGCQRPLEPRPTTTPDCPDCAPCAPCPQVEEPTEFLEGANPSGVSHFNNVETTDLDVTDDITVNDDITALGTMTAVDINATDDLVVIDDTTLTDDVIVGGNLQVTGTLLITGAVTAGDLTMSGAFSAADLTATDDLTVTDDATIGGNLVVTGTITGQGIGNTITTEAHTGNDTLTAGETGSLHTTQGSGGAVVLTLPTAAAGLNFCFYTFVAQNFDIDPGAGDQIHHLTNSAGDAIRNNTVGDKVCLVAVDATYWISYEEHGTWTDIN